MIKLGYNDDKKGKWRSHMINVLDDFDNYELGIYSHNPLEVEGYGATKEEALEDFMRKFKYVMDVLREFEEVLFETDIIVDNMVNVDALGYEIKE